MTAKAKDRIDTVVTVVCVLLCILLLTCVIVDRPLLAQSFAADHTPPVLRLPGGGDHMDQADAREHMLISEGYIRSTLIRYLPDAVSARTLDVKVSADGRIRLTAEIARDRFVAYIESLGVKIGFVQGIMLKLLPQTFAFEFVAACSSGPNGGALAFVPESVSVNGARLRLDALPAEVYDHIARSVNQLLADTGYGYRTAEFEPGAILLIP